MFDIFSTCRQLVDVVSQLCEICNKMNSSIMDVKKQLSDVKIELSAELSAVARRMDALERACKDGSAMADLSISAASASTSHSVRAAERLTQEQRCVLQRCPIVDSDEQWSELDQQLKESGQQGPFFDVMVKTVADRITTKSDVHKTANAALRAICSEPYIAERVTMAGYRKGKKLALIYDVDCRIHLALANLVLLT